MLCKKLFSACCQDSRHHPHEWFSWLLDDVLADFTGQRKKSPPPVEALETLRDISGTYARAVMAADPFVDVLGPVYMELSSHGSRQWFGQYFTPEPIARMIAEMTIDRAEGKRGGLMRVLDPACGSGVMLLSGLQLVMARHGVEALQGWSVTGVDLDSVCARMFAVQMLANMFIHQASVGEVVVVHGNSLVPDQLWHSVLHVSMPGVVDVVPVDQPVRKGAVASAAGSPCGGDQMALF